MFVCRNKCLTIVNKGELKKLKGSIWRPYCFFFHSEERGHVAALLTGLKAKWFANLTQNNGNDDEQCCVNAFLDRWKDTIRAGRESYGHTVQSVAARLIVHKFLIRSPAWNKPEREWMGLLWALRLASIG